ncbi:MAG: YfhO family protein [Acidimicrobiaceae bacterium]|nr:YfhO family protein [Acidimicrobiaceae bacterium]
MKRAHGVAATIARAVMVKFFAASRLPGLVAVGVVLFAFWPVLLGGGSFVAADIVQSHAAPFDAYLPEDFTLETDSTDPINIHSHWAPLVADLRSGDVGWWTSDLAGGQPTMKGGLPVFNIGYLVVPDWFAPGLVAALRSLVAIGLTYGFVRSLGLMRVSALAGGVAFAFSGFMVSWMNWPQSSVAALAPGLLWALERLLRDPKLWRSVPLGLVVAAMAWSNFPQVTVLVLGGAFVYGAIRLTSELRSGAAAQRVALSSVVVPVLLAAVLAALLAAPHLIGFAEYLDWGDTSYRNWDAADSSADFKYLLTAVAPAVWGHGSFGPLWFGDAGWNEPHAYVGASVALLALLGFVSGVSHPDRRCRSVVVALASVAGLGVLIGFVGGPVSVPLRELAGSLFGALARAKVLWNLGVALVAAFGVERLAGRDRSGSSRSLGRSVVVASALGLVLVVAFVPFGADWFDEATSRGVLREVLAVSLVPAMAAIAVAVIVLARVRGWLTVGAAGWALVAVVGFEMLSFVMPVHTIAESDQRLTATPAHSVVSELLAPGERLSGEGWTFFPSTTALFDIDDARGHVIKSAGYNALYRAEVPEALTLGEGRATPTWPYIPFDADIASPVWDAMAVGVWAQFPTSTPPGSRIAPTAAVGGADPAREVLTATLSSPPGGLRAVLVEVIANVGSEIDVDIEAAGQRSSERRFIAPQESGEQSFAFLGEDLPAGTPVSIRVSSPSPPELVRVGTNESGAVAAGMIAGDDEFRLARTGDVLLVERPNASFVRLADAAVVEADVDRSARAVAAREPGARSVVVDRDLGLPSEPAADSELEVLSVALGRDRIDTVVRADRAAVVVVSVSDYPGWRATVDGRSAQTVTADAAFVGVAVPEGEHSVTLTFRPSHLVISLLLAGSGIALAIGLLGIGWVQRTRRPGLIGAGASGVAA